MTQSQLNQSGFIFLTSELSIQPMTYREYLNEYGKDETTTPRGIGDRMFIREAVIDTDEEGDEVKEWQVCTWGVGGNNFSHCGPDFDNEEDAELYYYERSQWLISEKNWNAPRWNSTHDEAITDFSNSVEKSEDVVRRYLKLSAITARKSAEHRAEITRQNDARKEWLAIEVPKEADSIVIDDEFKAAVKWAEEVRGNEKSTRMASAMKGLLARNNKEKIETDFWQVIRILKAKVK